MMGRVINYTTDASDEDYVVVLNLFIVHLKCYCVFSSLHLDVMSWLIAAKCVQLTVDGKLCLYLVSCLHIKLFL